MANSAIGNGTIVGGTQTFITNTDESASLPNSVQLPDVGSWVLISTGTASSSATIDFTGLS